jgi:hypothetical protein
MSDALWVETLIAASQTQKLQNTHSHKKLTQNLNGQNFYLRINIFKNDFNLIKYIMFLLNPRVQGRKIMALFKIESSKLSFMKFYSLGLFDI